MTLEPVVGGTGGTMWRRIADHVIRRISTGDLGLGDRVPSEPELARQFRASRPTVVQALRHLVVNGWVERRQGVGTFVSGTTPLPVTAVVSVRARQGPVPALTISASSDTYLELVARAGRGVVARVLVEQATAGRLPDDAYTDWDVVTGSRGRHGCRAAVRIDLLPDAVLPLQVRARFADEFGGRSWAVALHLDPRVFDVGVDEPLVEHGPKNY